MSALPAAAAARPSHSSQPSAIVKTADTRRRPPYSIFFTFCVNHLALSQPRLLFRPSIGRTVIKQVAHQTRNHVEKVKHIKVLETFPVHPENRKVRLSRHTTIPPLLLIPLNVKVKETV